MATTDGPTKLLEEDGVLEEDATFEDSLMPAEFAVTEVDATLEDGVTDEEALRVNAFVTKPVGAPVPVG